MSEAEECLKLAQRVGEILSKYVTSMQPGDVKTCESIFSRIKEIADEQNNRPNQSGAI